VSARDQFDVAVVGASIAGCTAARLLGRAGFRVALVERSPDPDAYKVACTHNIQPSAVPTIERIGLAPLLEDAGAIRAEPAAWSPYGGWLQFPPDSPRGYGLTRRKLDPLLRRWAAGTNGVEMFSGETAVAIAGDDDRISGIETERRDGRRRTIRARLTVAADGMDSTVARAARVPSRISPNERFFYFAYWRGVEPRTARARLWFLDPDGAAVFANEDDTSVLVTVPHRRRLAEFRRDPEAAYLRDLSALPDGPDIHAAERVSRLIGKLDTPNKFRAAAVPGLALVGDAALAADPLFGVGCGWALESAAWLADMLTPALHGETDLDTALRRYRRRFFLRLAPHHLQIVSFSTGRPMRFDERLGFRAAATDPVVGRAFEEFATRRRSPLRFADPRLAPRILRAGLQELSRR
jgi:2-polyprenyl-6-methoxyphenol hydroxylase-like FAD-dependent oxidoreductase